MTGMMTGGNMMMGWGGMFFGGLMMLLWIGLIIALIVFLVRWISGSSGRSSGQSLNALDILEQRYARGEIDTAELEERTRQLRSNQ